MKKIKVLHVTSCFQYGGTEAYIMNNYRAIDKEKFSFDFWIFQEENSPYKSEINSLGGEVYNGEVPDLRHIFSFIFSLVKHIRNNGPYDVVHSHVNIMNAWVMLAALIGRVKIRISHSHDTSGKDTRNILKKIYYQILGYMINFFATDHLACSMDAGNYLYGKEYFSLYGEVVNNGITVSDFLNKNDMAVSKLKREYKIPENNLIIGNITRFESKKNQDFIVEIFKKLVEIEPNSTLILGGVDGGQLYYIKEKVSMLKMEDKVRFIGVRKDINQWLNLMDIYLFPSLYEGLGIVLLEAQAAGVKCIASTGVSKEADIGLGLVDFINLNKGPKYWAEHILKTPKRDIISLNDIYTAFDKSGYSVKASIKRVEKIYEGE